MKTVLRQETDQAVRMLLHLADAGGQCVSVATTARSTGVSKAFAHKIAQKLRDAGLLICRRGARGGLSLILDPSAVRLLDVVEAVQGPFVLSRCVSREASCPHCNRCRLSHGLAGLQQQFTELFRGLTLADLLREAETPA